MHLALAEVTNCVWTDNVRRGRRKKGESLAGFTFLFEFSLDQGSMNLSENSWQMKEIELGPGFSENQMWKVFYMSSALFSNTPQVYLL